MGKLLLVLLLAVVVPVGAAPQAELWERWQVSDADSTVVVSHRLWDDFLRANITEQNGIALLDYARVSAADQGALKTYLQQLSQTDVDALDRAEQQAFWINAYNALTVDLILAHYPVDSIRDISSGLFSVGPWDEQVFNNGGETLTLNDIEHRILRPIWRDARVHYAVNCASVGCPNLASQAFTAQNTEVLLEAGAKTYINHPRGAAVADGKLKVSSIYVWFIADFGGDDAGVIAHLKQYADEDLRRALEGITTVSDDNYDWNLNEPE